MLKKGDEIKWVDGDRFGNNEFVNTVENVERNTRSGIDYVWMTSGTYVTIDKVELVTTPRPHAELIKACADDDTLKVQAYIDSGCEPYWSDCNLASVINCPYTKYRIKPEKSEVDERSEALEVELMALKESRRKEQV